jgi:cytochrome P450
LNKVDGKYSLKEDPDMNATYYPFGAYNHAPLSPLSVLSFYLTEGIGIRGCMGKPLAEMELFMIIATIVRRFKITPAPQTTDETMQYVYSPWTFAQTKSIAHTQGQRISS